MRKPVAKQKKLKASSRNSNQNDSAERKKIPNVQRTSEGTIEESTEEAAP